ncbi:DUF4412 domain-containing protein [Gracilimonas mengyeensis]|nr:DUF4412 domain-containing protein [Gracilimonas mengyeensis]
MKNSLRAFFALLFISLFTTSMASAQFEGQISMKMYSNDNGKTDVSELNLYATSTRILIKGEENFDLMDKMTTDGLLIRNDMKDFIIMTGSDEALQVTKTEIEGLVDMLASWGGESSGSSDSDDFKTDYSFSDRVKTINGYETTEMIVKDKENPDKHLSVWLAPKIDINWGMLSERWKNMPESIDAEINGMSQELIFKGKNFPMLVEAVEGNQRTKIMEVTNVNESSVARAMVEIPAGVKLMSFKDYVFKMMMEG